MNDEKQTQKIGSTKWLYQEVWQHAIDNHMPQTERALGQMRRAHDGQYRDGMDHEPYIIHPLTMAYHAITLKIDSDELLAACLLHDVIEDCDVKVEELEVSPEVQQVVQLLTFREVPGMSREEAKEHYFAKIAEHKMASIVKILDRCNNVSTMAAAFSRKRMTRYIDETERLVMPIVGKVLNEYEEYRDAAFAIRYQMISVIDSISKML